MPANSVTFLCVVSLCNLIGCCADTGEYSCLRISACSCKLVGLAGEMGLIDLSPLKDKSLSAADSEGYLYRYFPCEAGSLGADAGTCDKQNHVAICQIQPNKSVSEEPIFTSCGNQSTAEFSVQSVSPVSLQLSFSEGEFDESREEYRLARLELYCNRSLEAELTALGEFPTLTYNFKLSSRYACPGREDSLQFPIGLAVLLVLLFYAGLYFVVGVSINILFLKKKGLEIIPNFQFWTEVPFLFRDGFIFSLSICYRPVGRRIATHTELEDSFEYREYNRIE